MRLEQILAAHAQRRSARDAVVCGAQRLTYAQLQDSVQRIASALHARGVRPGDRVLLWLPNCIEFVELCYAAFSVGAIVVPVNARLTEHELKQISADCQPKVSFLDLKSISALRKHPISSLPGVPPGQDDCLILYTSGTTGQPKGAVSTHSNMRTQALEMLAREWELGDDERMLLATPIAHRAGIGRMIHALGTGATVVIMEKFDPAAVLALIERERLTLVGFTPTVIRMLMPLLKANPAACGSVRTVSVSTEAFPVPLKRELMALMPWAKVHLVYGASEFLASNLRHEDQFTHPESVGRPAGDLEVRIADDAGNEIPMGEVGEVLLRDGAPGSGAVLREYYRKPAENAAAFVDGWFRTGDLARRDADGYLYIVDRKKDVVKSGGYSVYSKEVEEALRAHPAVVDAAVIGVPDDTYGEAVAAFIEAREGARPSAEELVEHCRARLASYKKPRHVHFVEALPRNSLGKVLKRELRDQHSRRSS